MSQDGIRPHRYVDKPTVAFSRDGHLSKPFIISMTTENVLETIRLDADEVQHLIKKGWS